MSDDGRFVPFVTGAANVVPGDTNGVPDLFVRNTLLGTTERASVSSTGEEGNDDTFSFGVAMSGDGRRIAFLSHATNLVPGDTNGQPDVFVRDLDAHTTTRVSLTQTGEQANGGVDDVGISDDGRFVAFRTPASNLVPVDTDSPDVFVRDTAENTTTRVSQTASGTEPNGYSNDAAISGDGSAVAFSTNASDLVVDDTNEVEDVVVATAAFDQPDLAIRRSAGPLVGTGVYNDDAHGQSISAAGAHRQRIVTYAVVRNSGNEADSFVLGGPGNQRHMLRTRYFAGRSRTDLTPQVTGAGYTTPVFDPGRTTTIRIEATFTRAAPWSSRFDLLVRAASVNGPGATDAVRARLHLR